MAGEIVAHNAFLNERAINLRTFFDSGHALRLFSNDFKPGPKEAIDAFAECTFPGYARVNMATKWKAVFKVIDGEFQFSSQDITFTPTGASNENAYGWYLVGDGKVKLSCRLPFPALMTIGRPLTVRLDVIVWAAVIL